MKLACIPLLLGALALPSLAGAAEGAWGTGTKAEVRLIAAAAGADGVIPAGIEIALPPGWHTYWRSPGDAGIAPVFDFSGSTNLASAEVSFPVPERLDDGVSVSNVYEDTVVLPVAVTAADPAQPVDLVVRADLGVCDDICVPDTASASLTVQPGERDEAAAATLAAAEARVPGAAEEGVFAVTSAERAGGSDKRPVFRVEAVVPDPAATEIFVEGPDDWAPYTPEAVAGSPGTWTVKFSRRGAHSPIEGASLRLTLVSGGRAIDQTIPID